MYKLSQYNHFIPLNGENKYLIYNSLYGSLVETGWEDGRLLSTLNSTEIALLSMSNKKFLSKNKIIIKSECNEKQLIKKIIDSYIKKINRDTISLTIIPTNSCNMECVYCFEGKMNTNERRKHGLNNSSIKAIIDFLNNQLTNNEIKKLKTTWYGGEPLMRLDIIQRLSSELIRLTDRFKINYEPYLVTNGVLLNSKTWNALVESKINSLQITLDGTEDIHNRKRPMVNGKNSYRTIINNLKEIPKQILQVDIRINADKKTIDSLDEMLYDLEKNEIWPQNANRIHLYLAQKHYSIGGHNEKKSIYLTSYDYHKMNEVFRSILLNHYNNWADKKGLKHAKRKIELPQMSRFVCSITHNNYGIVLDENGFIHKCWDHVNNKEERIQHISQFDEKDGKYVKWKTNKLAYEMCDNCNVLPICDENCTNKFIGNGPVNCSKWKYLLNDKIKEYYFANYQKCNENSNN